MLLNGLNSMGAIIKVFNDNIDFKKINSELPKLCYPNNTFEIYTKAQLLELL